jgi:hypothetical protein
LPRIAIRTSCGKPPHTGSIVYEKPENKKAGQVLKASAVLDESRSTSLPVIWSASYFSKFCFNRHYGFSVGVLWAKGEFLLFLPFKTVILSNHSTHPFVRSWESDFSVLPPHSPKNKKPESL